MNEIAEELINEYLDNLDPQVINTVHPDGKINKEAKVPAILTRLKIKTENEYSKENSLVHELKFNRYLSSPVFNTSSCIFEGLLEEGIPECLKSTVLPLMSSCHENIESYLQESMSCEHLTQIIKDISRTMPNHYFLTLKEQELYLFEILYAGCIFLKVEYTEGMNFLAGYYLQYLNCNEAFNCYISILGITKSAFDVDNGLPQLIYQTKQETEEQLPELYSYLDAMKIDFNFFIAEWYMSCFSKAFSDALFGRIIDLVLYYGIEVFIATAVELLTLAQDGLVFEHHYGPDNAEHIDEFYFWLENEAETAISCLAMPNSECLEYIESIGKSIVNEDLFVSKICERLK